MRKRLTPPTASDCNADAREHFHVGQHGGGDSSELLSTRTGCVTHVLGLNCNIFEAATFSLVNQWINVSFSTLENVYFAQILV